MVTGVQETNKPAMRAESRSDDELPAPLPGKKEVFVGCL